MACGILVKQFSRCILIFSFFLFSRCATAQPGLTARTTRCSVEDFGARGDGVTNDFKAFQLALESGCVNIELKNKTYLLDNSHDVLQGNNKFLRGKKTILKFTSNSQPLISFLDASRGGIFSVNFVYTGNTVTKITDSTMRKMSDYFSRMHAPAYELCAVIMIIHSAKLEFRQLRFESAAKADSTHGISFCINIKNSRDVIFNNLYFADCIHGILTGAVAHCRFTNIISERRFGNSFAAPGHVLYFSGFVNKAVNSHCIIDSVIDKGNPVNLNGRCLATLSLKFCDSFSVTHISSLHPEGLVQSFQDVKNSVFEDFSWSDSTVFTPSAAVLNFVSGDSIVNNKFSNFRMSSTGRFVQIASTSSLQDIMLNNTFKDFKIATPMTRSSNESKKAVIDINGKQNRFLNVEIEPLAGAGNAFNPDKENVLVDFRNNSADNHAEIIIKSKKFKSSHPLRSFSESRVNQKVKELNNQINIQYQEK
jgi:hypothetical protein